MPAIVEDDVRDHQPARAVLVQAYEEIDVLAVPESLVEQPTGEERLPARDHRPDIEAEKRRTEQPLPAGTDRPAGLETADMTLHDVDAGRILEALGKAREGIVRPAVVAVEEGVTSSPLA